MATAYHEEVCGSRNQPSLSTASGFSLTWWRDWLDCNLTGAMKLTERAKGQQFDSASTPIYNG